MNAEEKMIETKWEIAILLESQRLLGLSGRELKYSEERRLDKLRERLDKLSGFWQDEEGARDEEKERQRKLLQEITDRNTAQADDDLADGAEHIAGRGINGDL